MEQAATGPEETTPAGTPVTELVGQMHRLLYALFALMALMAIFVVYTSWRLNQFQNDRSQVLAKLDEQNHQLICVAEATRLFDIAIADALVEQELRPSYSDRLAAVRNKIAESDRLCLAPSVTTLPPPPTTGTTVQRTGTTSP